MYEQDLLLQAGPSASKGSTLFSLRREVGGKRENTRVLKILEKYVMKSEPRANCTLNLHVQVEVWKLALLPAQSPSLLSFFSLLAGGLTCCDCLSSCWSLHCVHLKLGFYSGGGEARVLLGGYCLGRTDLIPCPELGHLWKDDQGPRV